MQIQRTAANWFNFDRTPCAYNIRIQLNSRGCLSNRASLMHVLGDLADFLLPSTVVAGELPNFRFAVPDFRRGSRRGLDLGSADDVFIDGRAPS